MNRAVLPTVRESYRELEFLPYRDRDLGRIRVPADLKRKMSLPGRPTRYARQGEFGIFVAKQHKPVLRLPDGGEHICDDKCNAITCVIQQGLAAGLIAEIVRFQMVWHSITHNERVDVGAAIQANRMFGTSGTTANGVFTAVAVANAVLTKGHGDLSLGSASGGVTTNEFTASGLARAAGTVGTYTAPTTIARPGALTAVDHGSGAGALSGGNYRWAVTFVTSQGTPVAETDYNASCETGAIAITSGHSADLSAIPLGGLISGGPSPVVARGIYRTQVGGAAGSERRVQYINDNTTTTLNDANTDASISGNPVIPTTNTTGLGATFSQVISKVFTATATATAQGGGLFDQVTVASSNLFVEDNFATSASLATNDTLTETITITN